MRRVVVTGLGVVSPIGIGVDAFWNHLTHGVSGVGRITKFDPAGLPSQIAAEIAGFDPEAYLPRRDVVRTDTFIHFALTASQQALAAEWTRPWGRVHFARAASPGGRSEAGSDRAWSSWASGAGPWWRPTLARLAKTSADVAVSSAASVGA